MSITENLAESIGKKAKSVLNVDNEKEEIIVYGAASLLQIIFSILWVIIIGLLFGVLYETLIFSVAVSVLRKYSGGVHASSPSRCIIIGTTLSASAGIIIHKLLYDIGIMNTAILCTLCLIIAFALILKNAPVDSIQKPIEGIKIRKLFKAKSIFIIFVAALIVILIFILYKINQYRYYIEIAQSISLGILWQSITLTKIGAIAFNKVDFILKYATERRNM